MDGGILDKIYRITEFFAWRESASEARVRVGFIAYSVPLLGELALLRGASAAAMLPMVKILVRPPTRFKLNGLALWQNHCQQNHGETDRFADFCRRILQKICKA
jgi:hypothetical protein